MDFNVKIGDANKLRTACIVVGIFSPKRFSEAAESLDKASKGQLSDLLKSGDISTDCGDTTLIYTPKGNIEAKRILVVGCGKGKALSPSSFITIAASSAKALQNSSVTEAISCLADLDVEGRDKNWKVQKTIEACHNETYRFDECKSDVKPPKRPLKKVAFPVTYREFENETKDAIRIGKAIASGVDLARTLGNRPANFCTPTDLADQAKAMSKEYKSLRVQILEEKDMQKLGMGSLLSVSVGSRQPAKLIVMQHNGGKKGDKPVVLVGKGVTFDSGGISLKPGAAMDEMKFDMCGAASVFGTMSAVLDMQLAINLVCIVPATENMPDGIATKPGDVVTSMSGQTIEVLNTDAEGRLILCDALTYAAKYNPDVIIDIATLTGACLVALGKHTAGLLSNDQGLADDLLAAGTYSSDRAWQLPLWDVYDKQINSNFADMANIGGPGAGTITAACFLARFTKEYQWAHLDIAGVAWKSGAAKGATGRPVPLLTQFLMNRANDAG